MDTGATSNRTFATALNPATPMTPLRHRVNAV